MRKLENKTALVTGATSGIGKATAADFIANGAKVTITGRYRETVEETVKDLGESARGIVSDAGKMSDLMQLREQTEAIYPSLDILYVNAGIGKYAPIELIDEKHVDELFNIIVKGTLFTVRKQACPTLLFIPQPKRPCNLFSKHLQQNWHRKISVSTRSVPARSKPIIFSDPILHWSNMNSLKHLLRRKYRWRDLVNQRK
nr:SDR family NAD(P)-dependent oxidoreductase [Terrimonas ferruginea]